MHENGRSTEAVRPNHTLAKVIHCQLCYEASQAFVEFTFDFPRDINLILMKPKIFPGDVAIEIVRAKLQFIKKKMSALQ